MFTYSSSMKKNYQLADGESVLYLFTKASVLITDRRIQRLSSPGEVLGLTSILLEDVTSIQVRYDTSTWALILGVVAGITGLGAVIEFDALGLLGLGISAALLIYYFQSLESVIEFKSPSAVVKLPLKYLTEENIPDLVNKIEHARIISKM